MAKIPNLNLGRYSAQLRSQPGQNWNSLAMDDTERVVNQVVEAANSALVPSGSATSATAGSASALPATPDGYFLVPYKGTMVKVAYFKE